jgi:hypothetical protein
LGETYAPPDRSIAIRRVQRIPHDEYHNPSIRRQKHESPHAVADRANYNPWLLNNQGRRHGLYARRLHQLASNFGLTVGSGASAELSNTAVPEPATIVMLLVTAAGVPTQRCRRTWRASKLNNA